MFLNPNTSPEDTVGDLKKLVAAQTGTRADKIVLKKWWVIQSQMSLHKVDIFHTFVFTCMSWVSLLYVTSKCLTFRSNLPTKIQS